MNRPIINLKFGSVSLQAIERINYQLANTQIMLYVGSVGSVMGIFLNITGGTLSRAINITSQDWNDYNNLGSYAGLNRLIINMVKGIIQREACVTSFLVPTHEEQEFWQQLAGENCR